LVVENYLAEQRDLLKAVQRCRLRPVERVGLDAVDLQLDGLDFISGSGWNPIPIAWAACFPGTRCCRGGDQQHDDHACACPPYVVRFQTSFSPQGRAPKGR
jgi:hypothetical protein